MDINVFRYIDALERHRSYASAARELYITPQGLARAIKRLEAELEVPLVSSGEEGLQLTVYGDIFSRYAREMLDSMDAVRDEIGRLKRELNRSVTYAAGIGLVDYFPDDFADAFRRDHGASAVFIETASDYVCEQRLIDGCYDFAFLVQPVDSVKLMNVPIYRDHMFAWVTADDPLAGCESISAGDLVGRNIVFLANEFKQCSQFEEYRKLIPGDTTVTLVDEMIEVLHRAIRGDSIALTVRAHAEGIKVEGLRGIPLSDYYWSFSLCYRRERMLRDFDHLFIEYAQEFSQYYD